MNDDTRKNPILRARVVGPDQKRPDAMVDLRQVSAICTADVGSRSELLVGGAWITVEYDYQELHERWLAAHAFATASATPPPADGFGKSVARKMGENI